jgi:hypothetical protein
MVIASFGCSETNSNTKYSVSDRLIGIENIIVTENSVF